MLCSRQLVTRNGPTSYMRKYDGTALKVEPQTDNPQSISCILTSLTSGCSDATQYDNVQERQVSNGVI